MLPFTQADLKAFKATSDQVTAAVHVMHTKAMLELISSHVTQAKMNVFAKKSWTLQGQELSALNQAHEQNPVALLSVLNEQEVNEFFDLLKAELELFGLVDVNEFDPLGEYERLLETAEKNLCALMQEVTKIPYGIVVKAGVKERYVEALLQLISPFMPSVLDQMQVVKICQ